MYDGGTRVPFIVSWPGTVPTGATDATVSHVDFYSSFAELANGAVAEHAAPDSENLLGALLGRSTVGREEIAVEGMRAKTVLRQGSWTYIPPYEGAAVSPTTHTELGNAPHSQLYDLSEDIGQIANRADREPDRVRSMEARLREIICSQRTRR
jgi:arylsulfatase A-like enzyme